MKNKNKKFKKNWLVYFLLGGFVLKLLFLWKKDRVKDIRVNFLEYVEKEEKEVKKFIKKKETLKEFEKDSCSLFRQYFIPCDANEYHPKLLHTHSLVLVVVILIIIKIAVAGYLFFVYPNKGNMAIPQNIEILTLINADRRKQNLPVLTLNNELNRAAMEKLNDMGARNYFAHNSPDGKHPWDWINRNTYHYTFAGENLAMDFSTATAVHKALMESISHRKNILNQRFENIGIAMAEKTIDGERTNILVEMFGAQKDNPIVAKKITEAKTVQTKTLVLASKPVNHLPAALVKAPGIESPVAKTSGVKTPAVVKTIDKAKPVPAPAPTKIAETPAPAPVVAAAQYDPAKDKQIEVAVISEISEKNLGPKPSVVAVEKNESSQTAKKIISSTQYFYLFVFLALVVALSVNILIRISVQHKPVLVETMFTILIVVGFITTQAGYLEKVMERVIVF
jgi:hypothetical protein